MMYSCKQVRYRQTPWEQLTVAYLTLTATSFGKSLCYQLPAVINHGITIVISPLLALMNNQVAALRAAGISVATLNSGTPFSEKERIIDDLRCGTLAFRSERIQAWKY